MSVRIIIVSLAVISTAFRIPTKQKDFNKLCQSIVDCEACLLMPQCFAEYAATFTCKQYPVPHTTESNSSVVVDVAVCCPKAVGFNPQACGFGKSSVDVHDDQIVIWASVSGGFVVGTAIMTFIIIMIVKSCRKQRGSLNITTSGTASTNAIPTSCQSIRQAVEQTPPIPSTSKAVNMKCPPPSILSQPAKKIAKNVSLSEMLKADIKETGSAHWKARREALGDHPLDQSRG